MFDANAIQVVEQDIRRERFRQEAMIKTGSIPIDMGEVGGGDYRKLSVLSYQLGRVAFNIHDKSNAIKYEDAVQLASCATAYCEALVPWVKPAALHDLQETVETRALKLEGGAPVVGGMSSEFVELERSFERYVERMKLIMAEMDHFKTIEEAEANGRDYDQAARTALHRLADPVRRRAEAS